MMLTQCSFQRAFNELEHLVVQCLFEMTKLGMSSVGEL